MEKHAIFDLDREERELSDSFDRGEWKSVKNLEAEKDKAREAATNYLQKNVRGNLWT